MRDFHALSVSYAFNNAEYLHVSTQFATSNAEYYAFLLVELTSISMKIHASLES